MAFLLGAGIVLSLLLTTSGAVFTEESFEVTALFGAAANSTCRGAPPTICSAANHSVLDDDPTTWWQSNDDDDPVSLIFSLEHPAASLVLTGIRLFLRTSIPSRYNLEVISGFNSTEEMVYVNDSILCASLENPCTTFTVNANVIELNFSSNMQQVVSRFVLTLSGGLQSPEVVSYALSEVEIFAQVAQGFYARSLDGIRVEGESGIIQQTLSHVPHSANSSLFANFSGRGFASLNYTTLQRFDVQWVFSGLPTSSDYRICFKYSNHDRRSRRLEVVVMQGGNTFSARVTFLAGCSGCTSYLSSPNLLSQPANFSLTEAMLTIVASLSSLDVSLDAIVAIPREFYDPITLSDPARFLSACDVCPGLFMDSFCLQSALQLSIEYYFSTYECLCELVGPVCQAYGGLCDRFQIIEMDLIQPVGRRNELCPFFSYRTLGGCRACSCPSPTDDCNLETGACTSCPPFVFGTSCENCVQNSFSDEGTCTPCECDPVGSISCNQTSGDCLCKDGVGGESCDTCRDGHYNLSSTGCTRCDCGLGSINGSCNGQGQCYCQGGVSGLKCSSCSEGFYSLSSEGCLPCFCSNRTNQCVLASNITTSNELQENCSCPFPYEGLSCESCAVGYYLSNSSGECEQCNCNGRAERCADGNGDCIMCRNNTAGSSCDVCIIGMYAVTPSPLNLTCQPCPCSTVTATNNTCTVDLLGQPSCHCLPGHTGSLCDTCSSGYFGAPPATRCTDCSCNGNIDGSVPGSCDPNNGTCLICINNSTGLECQECQLGYFGDATSQNCQLCDCDGRGSNSSICDRGSGQCPCLYGAGGLKCDQCQSGFWNFQPGEGCQECECSAASNSSVCDMLTGQCACKLGVEGLQCSECMDGYYNLTDGGCSDCICGVGSSNQSCSGNGSCYCLPGTIGMKCDECLPFYSTLSTSGCQPCSSCEQSLAVHLFAAEDTIATIQFNFSSFLALMSQDLTANFLINSTAYSHFIRRMRLSETFDVVEADLESLNTSTLDVLLMNSLSTEQQVIMALARVAMMQPPARAIQTNLVEISNAMQEVFVDAGNVDMFVGEINNLLRSQVDIARSIQVNVSARNRHSDLTSFSKLLHERIVETMRELQDSVMELLSATGMQQNQTSIIKEKFSNVNITDTFLLLSRIEQSLLNNLEDQCNITSDLAIQLSPRIDYFFQKLSSRAVPSLMQTEKDIAQAEMLLLCAGEDIEDLAEVSGPLLSSEELSSGSGEQIHSGSGMIEEDSGLLLRSSGTENITSIAEQIVVLKNSADQLARELLLNEVDLYVGDNIARLLQHAQAINYTLVPVLEQGATATEAILDYIYVMNVLDQIENLSNQTEAILLNQSLLLSDTNPMLHDFLLLNISYQLLSSTQELSAILPSVLASINTSKTQEAHLVGNSTVLSNVVNELSQAVANLNRATNLTRLEVNQALSEVNNKIDAANGVSAQVRSLLPTLLNVTSTTADELYVIRNVSDTTRSLLNGTVFSTAAAWTSIDNRSVVFSVANQTAERNDFELDRVNSSLSALRTKLSDALAAAAMIDVALQFYGNSTYSYPSMNATATPFQSVSMLFNPDSVTSGDLLSSAMDETILQLSNGSVLMNLGTDVVSVGSGTVQNNQWYQLYSTIDNYEAIVSLTYIPHNGSTFTTVYQLSDPIHLLQSGSVTVGGSYEGCLDQIIINQRQLSLLNPLNVSTGIATCGPRPPSEIARDFEGGVWLFGGHSYIRLTLQEPQSSQFQMQFQFRTLDTAGLLLFYPSTDVMQHFVVYIFQGRVTVGYRLSTLDETLLQSASFYNTGLWYDVVLSVDGVNVTITINNTETLTASSSTVMESEFFASQVLLLGGLSAEYAMAENSLDITSSIAGCIRNLWVGATVVNLQESENFRADFGGCPDVVAPGVRFMGNGGAQFSFSSQQLRSVTFAFRTTQLAAHLLHVGGLTVRIFHTALRVDTNTNFILTSEETGLNDNIRHTVNLMFSLSGNNSNVSVAIDGRSPVSSPLPGPISFDRLFLGGAHKNSTSIQRFRGCIDSLVVNAMIIDFDSAETLTGVSLYGCRPAREQSRIPPPPPPIPPPSSPPLNASVGLSGSPESFISFLVSQDQVLESFSLTLEFMTVNSEGLLLFMQDEGGSDGNLNDFLALQLTSGRLLFSYSLGSGRAEIRSNGSYNDGLLHSVQVQRLGRFGQLRVDGGLDLATNYSGGNFTHLDVNSGYLFVGGTPATYLPQVLRTLKQTPPPLLACISSLSINGVFENLTAPHAGNGIQQCLSVYNNLVILQRDAYIIMLSSLNVGVRLNISVDFRTNNCSGLLFFVASSIYPDYLLVEIRNGQIVLEFNNGPEPETLVYNDGRQLCDNEWHSIFVSKDRVTGRISVDNNNIQTVLSSCETCQDFTATNTDSPLYVGGLPELVRSRYRFVGGSFEGSLSNLYIQQENRERQSLLFSQALQHENVQF